MNVLQQNYLKSHKNMKKEKKIVFHFNDEYICYTNASLFFFFLFVF